MYSIIWESLLHVENPFCDFVIVILWLVGLWSLNFDFKLKERALWGNTSPLSRGLGRLHLRFLRHPCIPCQKWVPSFRCRNLKHRVHRRLLPGDYTEYLKVQRIHRRSLPRPLRKEGRQVCKYFAEIIWERVKSPYPLVCA